MCRLECLSAGGWRKYEGGSSEGCEDTQAALSAMFADVLCDNTIKGMLVGFVSVYTMTTFYRGMLKRIPRTAYRHYLTNRTLPPMPLAPPIHPPLNLVLRLAELNHRLATHYKRRSSVVSAS
jgi:hypothetical protein